MTGLRFEKESYRIRGAVFEVYRKMGCAFLAAVYRECLEKESAKEGIPFVGWRALAVHHKRERFEQTYSVYSVYSVVKSRKPPC